MTGRSRRGWRRARTVQRLLLIGVACMVAGEALCLLGWPAGALAKAGPLRDERIVHVVCHAVLYAGIVLAAFGAALYLRDRLTGRSPKHRIHHAQGRVE